MSTRKRSIVVLALVAMLIIETTSTIDKGDPYFISHVKNITTPEGDTARFECRVKGHTRFHKVKWLYVNEQEKQRKLLSVNTRVITNNPKVKVTFDNNMTWTLHITRVDQTDQGQYQCEITNKQRQSGFLKVLETPQFIGKIKNSRTLVGETATFTCMVKGLTEYSKLAWFRLQPTAILSVGEAKKSWNPRHEIIHDGYKWTLIIRNVTQGDAGPYKCAVRTWQQEEQEAILKVIEPCTVKPQIATWEQIKAKLNSTQGSRYNLNLDLYQTETTFKGINMKRCPPVPCMNPKFNCVPSSYEEKHQNVTVNFEGQSLLLSLAFLEAKDCTCRENKITDLSLHFPILKIATVGNPQRFDPKTIQVPWKKIKYFIRQNRSLIDPKDYIDFMQSTMKKKGYIPFRSCLRRSSCRPMQSPTPVIVKKSASVVLDIRNKTKVAIIDYVEAIKCYCADSKPNDYIIPYLFKVLVARPCGSEAGGPLDVAEEVAFLGCERSITFPRYAPQGGVHRILVAGANYPTEPIIRTFENMKIDLTSYTLSHHWASSSKVTINNGSVAMHIKGVSDSDTDSYFSSIESQSSSACFTQVNLNVKEKPNGRDCFDICYPKTISLDWASIRQTLTDNEYILSDNADVNKSLYEADLNETLTVNSCGSAMSQCHGTEIKGSCVSSTWHNKKKTVCIPEGDTEAKVDIYYNEDETCACSLMDEPSILGAATIITHPVHFTKVEHVGDCPRDCKPTTIKVNWIDMLRHINKYSKMKIPRFIKGRDLQVRVCPQEQQGTSTKCVERGMVCDIAGQARKKARIKDRSFGIMYIIKYREASACTCRPRRESLLHNDKDVYYPVFFTSLRAKEIGGKERDTRFMPWASPWYL